MDCEGGIRCTNALTAVKHNERCRRAAFAERNAPYRHSKHARHPAAQLERWPQFAPRAVDQEVDRCFRLHLQVRQFVRNAGSRVIVYLTGQQYGAALKQTLQNGVWFGLRFSVGHCMSFQVVSEQSGINYTVQLVLCLLCTGVQVDVLNYKHMTGAVARLGSFFTFAFSFGAVAVPALFIGAPPAHAAKEISLKAAEVFTVFGFPITNSFMLAVIASGILLALTFAVRRKLSLIPGRLQSTFELIFEYVLNYMETILESRPLARKYFPLIMTLFLFLLVANWLAFFPGVGSLTIFHDDHAVPFLRPPAEDLNLGFALALIAFLTIEVAGVIALGLYKYTTRYINFSSLSGFFVGIVELISNLGRLVSFSFRLFGNIFAGEVMLIVVAIFVAFVLPVPLMAFKVFVGFIQAVVFAMLTLFFIKLSIMEPHGKEAH